MNSVRSNSLKLKYQRFTRSGCKDILIRKFKFLEKTQFLHQFQCRALEHHLDLMFEPFKDNVRNKTKNNLKIKLNG